MCKPVKTRRGLCVTKTVGKRTAGVSEVMLVRGLPYEVAGSVAVHELTHAWIRTTYPRAELPLQVEEGLCQLVSALWIEREGQDSQRGATVKESTAKLKEYIMWRIVHHKDPVY